MSNSHFEEHKPNPVNYVPLSPLSFIERTAALYPDRAAVIYGAREYSWGQVFQRCRRLSSALQKQGIGKGDTVSVLLTNTPEMIEAHFGVPASGAVLNTINYRLEAETVGYILKHSDCRMLIVDCQFLPLAKKALEMEKLDLPLVCVADAASEHKDCQGHTEYEAFIDEGDPNAPWPLPADEWQAVSLNYTSGTSGRPKGVIYHHRGAYLMSMGTVSAWSLPHHPVYLYTVPMFHCNGWGHAWTMCLQAGTIICCRAVSAKFIFDSIERYSVTHFGGAPIVLGLLVNADKSEVRKFPHRVKVMTAGAPPPAVILRETAKLGFDVMQVYGLTETYGHVSCCLWREEWDDLDEDTKAEIKSWQGVALPMTEKFTLIDPASGQELPKDSKQQGEIAIRGNTIMKGYYKDLEATAQAFSGGWFHSGDAAVWQESGYVQITDRMKDVIISGGENISTVDVEGKLHHHPAVANAAVVGRQDEKWGEVPWAFVELKKDMTATEEEIIKFCKERLAGFKVPKRVIFQELPKTATGKIQKYILRQEAKKH